MVAVADHHLAQVHAERPVGEVAAASEVVEDGVDALMDAAIALSPGTVQTMSSVSTSRRSSPGSPA